MLFVVLPFIVKGLGGDFTVGVLMGTGVVLVWYTIETAGLRNAAADQSGLALEQIKIASAQYQVALQQVDAAISPLLVSRLELADGARQFALRNIGHGPALFVQIEMFTVEVPNKGLRRVRVFPVDLVEPKGIGIPVVEFHLAPGVMQGQLPDFMEFVDSLLAPPSGHAMARHEIKITYQDVQGRQFQSLMEMGMEGTKLLKYGPA